LCKRTHHLSDLLPKLGKNQKFLPRPKKMLIGPTNSKRLSFLPLAVDTLLINTFMKCRHPVVKEAQNTVMVMKVKDHHCIGRNYIIILTESLLGDLHPDIIPLLTSTIILTWRQIVEETFVHLEKGREET